MKSFFKKVALWAGLLLIVLILISFLLPKEVIIKSSITINAPMFRVFDQVNDLRNWERWSPWKKLDPMMEMTFSNPPVGQDAYYKWESKNKNVGSGTLTLAQVSNDEKIVTALHFEHWGDASSTFDFGHKDNAIQLTWSMTRDVGIMPWNKYLGLVMKSGLKKQFTQGLEGIKFYAEKS